MEQSSWEAKGSEENPHILWNEKVYCGYSS
jgi:hypothetical protein